MEKSKISQNQIEEAILIKAKLDLIQEQVGYRVQYIVDFLADVLEIHDYEDYSLSWYYDTEASYPWDAIYDNKVHIIIEEQYKKGACLLLEQSEDRGLTWDFFDGVIPLLWLTDDFEDEVIKAREAYLSFCENQNRKKLDKKKAEKALKKQLIEKAKSKLTDEELQALNLKK